MAMKKIVVYTSLNLVGCEVENEFEIDEDEWNRMTDEEKDEAAKDAIMMDWWWEEG